MVMPIKNTSVLLTIAEIRFEPILNIQELVPSVQDDFRMAQYGEFLHMRNQGFHVTQTGNNKSLVPTTHDVYQFSDSMKFSHFRLNNQCLTYQSSNYVDFETFLALFLEGLFIISKVLDVPTIHRVGLRFLDKLVIQKGEKIQNYLAPSESQLFEKLGANTIHSQSEIRHMAGDIQLFNRVKIFKHGTLEFPKDIEPGGLVFKEKFTSYEGPSATIDTDVFIEKNIHLTIALIKKYLYELHDLNIVAFEASVSDIAKKVGF